MNFIQMTAEIYVPERTAELADRMPGVRFLLSQGVKVLHYEDARELQSQEQIDEESL